MDQSFFVDNRRRLAATYRSGGLFVVPAYTQMQRGNDTSFSFEQEANFWWLTGISAPDWWLIHDGLHDKSWLVAPSVSQTHELFDGSLPADIAQQQSGIGEVISREDADSLLRRLARSHSVVYSLGDDPMSKHYDFTLNPADKDMWQRLSRIFGSVQDCRRDLAKLRAIKQPAEIKIMQQAIDMTTAAFADIKSRLGSFKYEYEVEAEFSHYFRRRGAAGHAYDPIVAGGANACTLHYTANQSKLSRRELLLLDIGVRHQGYAADITRTYALADPTKRQRQVHQALQVAQAEIVNLLAPGVAVEQYQRDVDRIMQQALISLGLIKDHDDPAYRQYFPHAISHGLGIDVHDGLGGPQYFEPGMVLTVEPGIYIPEEKLGLRIEDDILITDKGRRNLSASLSTEW